MLKNNAVSVSSFSLDKKDSREGKVAAHWDVIILADPG